MEERELDRLLKITRLRLTEEERSRVKSDINEVLEYFDGIDGMRSGAEPAYQPIRVPGTLRKDAIQEFDDLEGLTRPSKLHKGYIVGPKL